MCGIAGIARLGGGELTAAADGLLDRLATTLAHRGPDDRRVLREANVGLAFARLSLVAPTDGGQPLVSEDGSVVLIANGEVYNHRELEAGLPAGTRMRTKSDCEVLLHLYQRDGLSFLDKVNGMFAFVLWDRKRDTLLLGRDRFGIKPLYYHRDADRIVFASEIKALFADPATPRRLDWEGALGDLALSATPAFVHAPVNTWFEGIGLVPAATVLEIRLGDNSAREHRYWTMPEADADSDASDQEYIAAYRDLLAEAVKDCATADAELGLFLSGGIDSAAVAALAGHVQTFTVLTGSTLLNGDAEWAHRIAKVLGLPNEQVLFDVDRTPGAEEWKQLLWQVESPLCSPEVYYKNELHKYSRSRHPQIKGMLLGAASDEFNGGYTDTYAEGPGWDGFMESLRGFSRRTALLDRPRLAQWYGLSDVPLLRDEALRATAAADPYQEYLAWKYRSLQQYNVWHEDRTAAGNSIEARVPFLDHRLVELVVSIPAERRARLLLDKRILREAMVGVLPEEVRTRPKVPFYHGDGRLHTYRTFTRMLTQQGNALVEEALSTDRAREFIHADGIRENLRRLREDREHGSLELLLRVVNLGLLERMTEQLPPEPSAVPTTTTLRSVPVEDWDESAAELGELTLHRPEIAPDAAYTLGPQVLLAAADDGQGTWYVIVDGAVEYVVEETADETWLALLRGLDGSCSLREAVAKAGGSLGELRELVEEAVEQRLIVPVPS
ncbi:asparagine synthase (glutamine-hydrolyzing) [Kitasatospora sp. NPDC002227]|uniref:asparagine synthase (glutamine-hydrolyzing) n=1 Tax=Kitasatospora sp. NPDC002227 TaxID=3154773 RepID=UPI0033166AE2